MHYNRTNSIYREIVLLLYLLSTSIPLSAHAQVPFVSHYATIAPTIDGNITAEEYQMATALTLSSSQGTQCIFYIMNDSDNVYVAVSAINDSTNTTPIDTFLTGIFDNMAIWFGRNGADIIGGESGYGYWLYGNSYLRTRKIFWNSSQLQAFQSLAEGKALGPPNAPQMNYELRIPLEEIKDYITNMVVRAGIHYWNDYDTGPSFWDPPSVNVYRLDTYGNLILSILGGDVNFDGAIDLKDLIVSLQTVSGLNNSLDVHKNADVNGDGVIGLEEAVYIMQAISDTRAAVLHIRIKSEVK